MTLDKFLALGQTAMELGLVNALTAAIAELRSPASTVPRVSFPDASLAMYWKVAI